MDQGQSLDSPYNMSLILGRPPIDIKKSWRVNSIFICMLGFMSFDLSRRTLLLGAITLIFRTAAPAIGEQQPRQPAIERIATIEQGLGGRVGIAAIIAILLRPDRAPILVAVYLAGSTKPSPDLNAAFADVGRIIADAF